MRLCWGAQDTTPCGDVPMRNGEAYMIRSGLCQGESNISDRKLSSLSKNIMLLIDYTPFYLFLWTTKLVKIRQRYGSPMIYTNLHS